MNPNNWTTQYFNKNIIDKIDQSLLDLMKTTKDISSLETKIEQQEEDYMIKINEIKDNYNEQEIIKNYQNIPALGILQKELEIIKLISKYSLQNNYLSYDFIICSLKYVLHLSEILRKKINQSELDIEPIDNIPGISRCSYKFCNFKETCTYNYNKTNNYCYQDHYVHNMVSHDIKILIEYIQTKYETTDKIQPNKEILKSINTLSYVINHMETELKTKCIYLDKQDWDKHHYINTIKK